MFAMAKAHKFAARKVLLSCKQRLEKLQRSGVHPSEKLTSLGIKGESTRAPLTPLEHHGSMAPRYVRVTLNWAFIMPELLG